MIHHIIEALRMTGIMAWSMLWALCLGFLISGVIEAVVSKEQLSKLLPDSSARTILIASGLGAASSSDAEVCGKAASGYVDTPVWRTARAGLCGVIRLSSMVGSVHIFSDQPT